MKNSGRT